MKKNQIAMCRTGEMAAEWAIILFICVHPVYLWLAFSPVQGSCVGKIRRTNQGGFIVEDASASQSGNSSLMKQVRVVTTIDFYLTD